MKSLIVVFAVTVSILSNALNARAQINVFACEPEWGALAHELGGEKVAVVVGTTALQDPHFISARPSLIAAARNADLIVCSGASLEIGWLPLLLQKSGNEKTQPGGVGYLLAADYIRTLEKPTSIDRSKGDVHPEGNPHLHLNPHNLATFAEVLTKRLKDIDEKNATLFQSRFEDFSKRWHAAMSRWEESAKALKGAHVVVHHKSFTYLIDWLGLREVGTLELKPGIPPTSSHLESLLATLKASPPRFILRTPFDPEDASEWLSQKTGTPAVRLPYTVGGDEQSTDLFALFDRTVALLTNPSATHG